MYCPNCGAQNAQDAAFCQNCGVSLHEETTTHEEFVPNTPMSAPEPEAASTGATHTPDVGITSSLCGMLKSLGSSPLFLTAAVAYTASVFLSIVRSVIGINFGVFAYQLYELADEFGVDRSLVHSFFDGMRTGSVIGAVSGAIPSILFAVGLWLIYASCSDRYDPYIKTGGLTTLKVLQILKLIGICLSTFFAVAAFLILFFAANAYFAETDAERAMIVTIVLGIFAGIVILVLALSIVYEALALRTINRMKRSALSGAFCGYGSGFVGVMLIIGSVFTLIGAIPSAIFGCAFAGFGTVASGVASFCFGLLIFRYNKTLRTHAASVRPSAHVGASSIG